MEVLEGPTGRRSWTDEKKAKIVAESFAPGESINEVARRHDLQPQHLSTWRRLANEGKIVFPHNADLPNFAPIVIDEAIDTPPTPERSQAPISIEVETDGVTVRVPADIDADRLADIITALRAAR